MCKPIGLKLRELRKERNLAKKEIAAVIDKKETTYAAYEECRAEPSLDSIFKLCLFYHISFESLMRAKEYI